MNTSVVPRHSFPVHPVCSECTFTYAAAARASGNASSAATATATAAGVIDAVVGRDSNGRTPSVEALSSSRLHGAKPTHVGRSPARGL